MMAEFIVESTPHGAGTGNSTARRKQGRIARQGSSGAARTMLEAAVEAVVDHLVRPLLRVAGFVLVDVLGHFVWHVLCHVTGWVVLRTVTLGRHPRGPLFDREDSGAAEWVGALVLVVAGGVTFAALTG